MPNYITVTEAPGNMAPTEQLERLFQRYHFAYERCAGKDVLEVACGTGQGLGYLAETARQVVGGDLDDECLAIAQSQYRDRPDIRVERLDAQNLPFAEGSQDIVILFEAVYYLPDPERFVDEAHRVLRGGGSLILCSANKDLDDFNPSPFSVRYFSVPELVRLLERRFAALECYGGFPVSDAGTAGRLVSMVKRIAVALHLMPKTMKGKEFLKRVFFGKLRPIPGEVRVDMAAYRPPAPIPHGEPDRTHKVLFAVGTKQE